MSFLPKWLVDKYQSLCRWHPDVTIRIDFRPGELDELRSFVAKHPTAFQTALRKLVRKEIA